MKCYQSTYLTDDTTKQQLRELAGAKTLCMSAMIRLLIHDAYSQFKSNKPVQQSELR